MIRPEELAKLSEVEQRALLRELLQKRSSEGQRFPASVQQTALWHEARRNPAGAGYNVALPSRIRSTLDPERLFQAFRAMAGRHASLRTTFEESAGTLFNRVHRRLDPECRVVAAEAATAEALRTLAAADARRAFDLENGPLLRLTLLRVADDDWIAMASSHHIVVDFWSLVLMLNEMKTLYRDPHADRTGKLAPAENNYGDFVARQERLLSSESSESLRRYWQRQIDGAASVIDIPTDFVRPQRFTGEVGWLPLRFDEGSSHRIVDLAKQAGMTTQALVLASVQILVQRLSGQRSFLIGSPFSGRVSQAFESTVGFFVNMLPLRAELEGDPSFLEVAKRASDALVGAMQHEELPLAEILRAARIPHDPSRSPLFQVSCTFEKSHLSMETGRASFLFSAEETTTDFAGLTQQSFQVPPPACHCDIEFLFERTERGFHGAICFCRDLFVPETIESIAGTYQGLVRQLVEQPHRPLSEISFARESMRLGLEKLELDHRERTFASDPTQEELLILDAPRRFAESQPDHEALVGPGLRLTYRELDQLADQIARGLVARGVGPETLVPVFGQTGPATVPAMLGVLRSGAAFIPIDVRQPAVSAATVLEETGAPLAIDVTPNGYAEVAGLSVEALSQGPCLDSPLAPPTANQLCYVVFTSGSSGRPKGVMLEHGALDNTLRWRSECVPLSKSDRVLVLLSHQFDAALALIFTSLAQGATLVWSDEVPSDIDATVDLMADQRITVLPAIPSLLALYIEHPRVSRCDHLRQLWTGAEAMPNDLPKRVRDRLGRPIPFWNFYGPTEAAIEAAAADVSDHDLRSRVPIGTPIRNTEVLVLDEHQRPLPPAMPGELAICGAGLARGYLNNPALTASRFPTLGDGRRVFLTGDRCRRRADGMLEFLGRHDQQVKLDGYRIELEEIEHVLRECALIRDAAALVRESPGSRDQLVAFLVLSDPSDGEESGILDQIRHFISEQLPAFKRPKRLQCLAEIPKLASGKYDRQRLGQMVVDESGDQPVTAARTPLEQFLVDRFRVSTGSEVGIHHDFFEAGGTSLQAAGLAAQLSDQLEVQVSTTVLFEQATVALLAERLVELYPEAMRDRFGEESVAAQRSLRRSSSPEELVSALRRPDSPKRTPLFLVHPPGGIVVCYRQLAARCVSGRAVFAIRSRGLYGSESLPETMEAMAAEYAAGIQATCNAARVQLGGWSLGGVIAYEVARQLMAQGVHVERLIMLDSALTGRSETNGEVGDGREYGLNLTFEELARLTPDQQLPLLLDHARKLGVLDESAPREMVDRLLADLQELFHHHVELASDYQPQPISVPLLLVRPRDVPISVPTAEDRGWSQLVSEVNVEYVSGHHHSMVQEPGATEIAQLIQ